MKKHLVLVIALIMALGMTMANAENNVEGIWVKNSGMILTVLKINADKTCSWVWISFNGDVSTANSYGTWEMNGNRITASTEAAKLELGIIMGQKATFNIKKQTFVLTMVDDTLKQEGTDQVFQKVLE